MSYSGLEIFATIAFVGFALACAFVYSKKAGLELWPFIAVLCVLLAVGMARFFPGVAILLEQPDERFYTAPDERLYIDWAHQLSALWISGTPVEISKRVWPGSGVWSVLFGLVTVALGSATVFMLAMNAVLVSFSFLFLRHSTSLLFEFKNNWIALFVFVSNPAVIFHGASLLREGSFWFGTSLLILGLALISSSRDIAGLIALVSGSGVILAIRPNLGVFFVFFFLSASTIVWIWVKRHSGKRYLTGGLGFLSLLLILFPFGIESLSGTDDLPKYAAGASRELSEGATTGFLQPEKDNSSREQNVFESVCGADPYVMTACRSLSNSPSFLFGPFFWELRAGIVFPYLLVTTWNFAIVLGLSATTLFSSSLRSPASLALFITGAVLTLLLAASLTNYGAVARFRVVVWLLLVPLAWAGIEKFQNTIMSRIKR